MSSERPVPTKRDGMAVRLQRRPANVEVLPGTDVARWTAAPPPPGKIRRHWRRGFRHLREFFANPHDISKAFEFYYAVSQPDMEVYFQRFVRSAHGPRLLTQKPDLTAVIRDKAALAAMPEGSFGRTFYDFLEEFGYESLGIIRRYNAIMDKWRVEMDLPALDADRAWFVERYMAAHDLHHIVTGYGTDELGEGSLSAFTLGQHYGFGLMVLTSGATMHFVQNVGPSYLHYAWRAWRRGRRAQPLYCAPWEELLPLPLDLVIEMLDITPIHQSHPNGIWAASFNPPYDDPYLTGEGEDGPAAITSESSSPAGDRAA